MRLDWVVPCRYAEAPGDGTVTITGAGVDTFWLDNLPGLIGVFVAMRIVGTEEEVREQHQLALRLLRPDLSEDGLLEVGVAVPELPPLKQPGWETGLLVPAAIQFEALEYGTYSVEILLDGQRAKSVPISVRPRAELQQA